MDAAPPLPGLPPTAAAAAEWGRRMGDLEVEHRRAVVRFAALLCTCRPWYVPGEPDMPSEGCPVHGNILITATGEVI